MSAAAVRAVSPASLPKIANKPWLSAACVAASDVAAVLLVIGLISAVFGHSGGRHLRLAEFSTLIVFLGMGVYPGYGISAVKEFRRILTGATISHGLIGFFLFLETPGGVAWEAVCFGWAATIVSVIVCRAATRSLAAGRDWWGAPVVVFGSGPTSAALVRHLEKHSSTGLRVVAIIDDNLPDFSDMRTRGIFVGTRADASGLARDCGVARAMIALPNARGSEIRSLIQGDASHFKHLLVIPDLGGITSAWVEPRDLGGVLGLEIERKHRQIGSRVVKRASDLILGSLAALAVSPLLLLIVVLIKLTSKGPVFYGHSRVGLDDSRFTAWKFRSMYQNADELLFRYLQSDPELRREWERDHKLRRDPRITRIGRILRKTSLDELPQLWNVLRGDMSLVGPRPIVQAEIPRYGTVFETYASVRPGITGMWQVSGRNDTSYEERVQFDEYYVTNWSIWLDLYILGRTVKTVILREGAY